MSFSKLSNVLFFIDEDWSESNENIRRVLHANYFSGAPWAS
jgi:hypothetical protein